ncbi:AbrB/MazE/SpoVT family DNA-binding domain-containing protein [Paenibacillus sp. HN-1]|uniref:AbrB/MazE/SpoVT family DNA-binding domain-containing protein n=1 Tax=Paenibacillus TaxID=44249 RepID=UPI001CA97ED3|nr:MULTISPECIES: AbrB/MazE/SpoVT family DNA-binding domain-containing protein [Paenibacillus]MBY9081050.1 AbrB/MazE/SpoVT family DNA-binding domain-containing protein [Paenibacillus sp. CGMCC 1.18879]MBY9087087.1 AbrB/MazE/SpoVT family DNA-binding domain-containing protein [Paenibacillus sinensis]
MKSTGIVRKIDELGRLVIPIELRRTLNLEIKDPVEIFVDGEMVLFRKYAPGCAITGSQKDLVGFEGKQYSREVIKQLAKIAGLI